MLWEKNQLKPLSVSLQAQEFVSHSCRTLPKLRNVNQVVDFALIRVNPFSDHYVSRNVLLCMQDLSYQRPTSNSHRDTHLSLVQPVKHCSSGASQAVNFSLKGTLAAVCSDFPSSSAEWNQWPFVCNYAVLRLELKNTLKCPSISSMWYFQPNRTKSSWDSCLSADCRARRCAASKSN